MFRKMLTRGLALCGLIAALSFLAGCGGEVTKLDSINLGRAQAQKLQYDYTGKLELADLFQDGMMLCGDRPFRVWGLCEAGKTLTVALLREGKAVQTRQGSAASDHSFAVWFDSVPASAQAYSLKVTAGKEEIVIDDILFGRLFLAGGQSNMELKLNVCRDGASYAQENSGLNVRFYQTQPLPLENAQFGEYPYFEQYFGSRGSWGRASDLDSALSASAVAFSFACELSKALNLPVGFVDTSVGGTTLESWLPRDLMEGELAESAARRNKLVSAASWNQAEVNMNQMTANHNLKLSPVALGSFSGVVWYQGESNISDSGFDFFEEGTLALVRYLSRLFGYEEGQMPFVSVQLAPYAYFENDDLCLPRLWESQQSVLEEELTALIPIYDLPDDYADHPLHPITKLPVGERLARSMQALLDGDGASARAPRVIRGERTAEGALLTAESAGVLQAEGEPAGFEAAGADGVFYPAQVSLEGRTLSVRCPEAGEICAVRYNYHQLARTGNVTDGRFLLLPFSLELA